MKVFVLCKHNGENQEWHEIDAADVPDWTEDGSIRDGDRVVFPSKVLLAKNKTILPEIELLEAK